MVGRGRGRSKLRDSPSERRTKRAGWVEALKLQWWPIPIGCVAAAILLVEVVSVIDAHLGPSASRWYMFGGGPPSARRVLAVVASSTLTFAGLVFSVTMVVLQLASSQYSPRVIRTFLRDRLSQGVLGLFAGTFVYALLGLRKVHGDFEGVSNQVPEFTVWSAVMLAIACVVAFVVFIHHIANAIRASVIIRRIGDETRTVLRRLYPESIGSDSSDPVMYCPDEIPSAVAVWSAHSGVLQFVDEERLVRCAEKWKVVLGVISEVGSFVPQGSPLVQIWGSANAVDFGEIFDAVHVGRERTMQQDARFGFRQLVDIALRALSPALNDPTTAVDVLHQLHDLLRNLVRRRFPPSCLAGSDGTPRLLFPRPAWTSYVETSIDDIRRTAEGSRSVLGKLRDLTSDVARSAPPHRREVLEQQMRLIDAALDARDR